MWLKNLFLHIFWNFNIWPKPTILQAYSLCKISNFQNGLISGIFGVFSSGFLHRTTLMWLSSCSLGLRFLIVQWLPFHSTPVQSDCRWPPLLRKGKFFSSSLTLSWRLPYLDIMVYLAIIPRARMGSESIVHEAEGWMGYWLRGHEGEKNNCFSKIQLVRQKYN